MFKKMTKSQINELISFFFVICIALFIRTTVMELFFVPTGSMKATILENDYIFSTKYSYGYSQYSLPFNINIGSGRIFASQPQRGDIIIFRPPNNMSIRYIKRLIGMPGDKIQLINDIIYINDVPIIREKIGTIKNNTGRIYTKYKEILPNKVSYYSYKLLDSDFKLNEKISTTKVFYVPQNKYFFLGDNRDESGDSRFDLGFVPFENFIAKAQFIIFSTEKTFWNTDINILQQVFRIKDWILSVRINRLFLSLY